MKTFEELSEEARNSINYKVQQSIFDFTDAAIERMDLQGISKSYLASKMGTSPAFITKLLSGNNNFTLRTMVTVADFLGCKLVCKIEPKEATASNHQVIRMVNLMSDHYCQFPSPNTTRCKKVNHRVVNMVLVA